ncbi:MAG: hypothetical protein ACW9XA_05400 [Candidatus Nitrosopumilus sp. bin_6a]
MNFLIALVIAIFIIVGVYVGYHVSQQEALEGGEAHNITVELETLNDNSESVQILQNPEIRKTIL